MAGPWLRAGGDSQLLTVQGGRVGCRSAAGEQVLPPAVEEAVRAEKGEKEGTVVNQEKDSSLFVPNYSRVAAEIALPKKQKDDSVIGLFTATLPSYPYAVEMNLESSKDGVKKPVVTLKHKGGNVTIPYEAERGSDLILSISDRVVARQIVE